MKKISIFTFLIMCLLISCEVSTTSTMEVKEKPYVIEANDGMPITELDYIYRHCSGGLYTKTYEVDGQRYQIFWTGDGSDDGSLIVINLEEQEARIKYYKDNSRSY